MGMMKGQSGTKTRLALKAIHRQDLDWWIETLPGWDGIYLFEEEEWLEPSIANLYTNVSDFGGGAIFGNVYFTFEWAKDIDLETYTIQFREMFTIVSAMLTFQVLWKRKRYYLETDSNIYFIKAIQIMP